MRNLLLLSLFSLYLSYIQAQPIDINPDNPWYWTYKSKPVMLIGGSNEDNLFQSPDYLEQLDLLQSLGGNYVRCTMSSRDEGNIWAFAKGADGLYNLREFNPEYWQRFADFLAAADERGIIVQVEVWATFDFYREPWLDNPFNPKNNSTLNQRRTRLPDTVSTHPIFRENPFFWSVPEMDNNTQLLAYQQRFVDQLLDISLKHDNVLYCIDNETSVTATWPLFWARYIRAKAKLAGRTVHVTEMWDPHDLDHPDHLTNLFHDDIFTFLDISQNNHKKGQEHYDNGRAYRQKVAALSHPKPLNTVKTYGKDKHGSAIDGVQRFWRSAFLGAASVRFHRPNSGHGLETIAQANIKSMRMLCDALPFWEATATPEILMNASPNEAYAIGISGKTYAVYFPETGAVRLNLPDSDAITLQWLDIDQSEWSIVRQPGSGKPLEINNEDDGKSRVALIRVE
ncbi:hypothetical protein [Phaeodactylibacter xiamenensis]|uniref:hypothetical protein n=1 Tax=Phaeodactylibacter xiamenensis TaxID=1524460 RepID=UPI003CCB9D8D